MIWKHTPRHKGGYSRSCCCLHIKGSTSRGVRHNNKLRVYPSWVKIHERHTSGHQQPSTCLLRTSITLPRVLLRPCIRRDDTGLCTECNMPRTLFRIHVSMIRSVGDFQDTANNIRTKTHPTGLLCSLPPPRAPIPTTFAELPEG